MKQQQKMNNRQWRLYDYIKICSLNNTPTSKEDICYMLPELYKGEHNKNENGSFINCPMIYSDIRFINNSGEVEKIIVVDNNKIYLGNEETCKEYVDRLIIKAKRLFLRASQIKRKMKLDGQGIMPIDGIITEEQKTREFVETYIRNELGIKEDEENGNTNTEL